MTKWLGTVFLLCFSVSVYAQEEKEIIQSIYFGGGSYLIDQEQLEELYKLIDGIENLQYYQITISSHTDNIGGAAYNQWLSEQRSRAVYQKLVEKQVSKDQIIIHNNGQKRPHYDNDTHMGRLANRRVDIIFTPIIL